MLIKVNTRDKEWKAPTVTYNEVVALAELPNAENRVYTITYAHGSLIQPEGSLVQGQDVTVIDGMIFNVSLTNNA